MKKDFYRPGLGSEYIGIAVLIKHCLQALAVLERQVMCLQ